MKNLMQWLIAGVLLLIAAGCHKEAFDPTGPLPAEPEAITFRSPTAEEAVSNLIDYLRTQVHSLIDDGTLSGANGNGILNSLDLIEKKFGQGQKEVALNMLEALSNHLDGLSNGSVITEEVFTELLATVEFLGNAIQGQGICEKAPAPILVGGLNVNLPLTGIAILPPEPFLVAVSNECGGPLRLSFSQNPDDQSLPIECGQVGANEVYVWVTNLWGLQDYGLTTLNVQNNFGICENGIPGEECAPIAIAYSGLVVDLTGESVTIPATRLDAGSIDACGTGSLTFAVKRHDDPAAIPAETITFFPEDVGYQGVAVELWVSDGVQASMVLTAVIVYDVTPPVPV